MAVMLSPMKNQTSPTPRRGVVHLDLVDLHAVRALGRRAGDDELDPALAGEVEAVLARRG